MSGHPEARRKAGLWFLRPPCTARGCRKSSPRLGSERHSRSSGERSSTDERPVIQRTRRKAGSAFTDPHFNAATIASSRRGAFQQPNPDRAGGFSTTDACPIVQKPAARRAFLIQPLTHAARGCRKVIPGHRAAVIRDPQKASTRGAAFRGPVRGKRDGSGLPVQTRTRPPPVPRTGVRNQRPMRPGASRASERPPSRARGAIARQRTHLPRSAAGTRPPGLASFYLIVDLYKSIVL